LTSENGLRENGLRENGLRENGLRENGLRDLSFGTTAFKAWFDRDRPLADNVMTYVAKCALNPGQYLRYTDGGGRSYAWAGSLGLAPGWATRAATVAEQEWVSACLMAFTNKCGNQVTISLRAPAEGAPETNRFPLEAGEREGWKYQEAAFFGNLFASTGADANACDGGGGQEQVQMGLGRECGSDNKNCGHKAQGACASKCTISTNADKYYKSCTANGRTYARVITTYLDPTTWRGAMDCRNKSLEDDGLSAGSLHVCSRAPSGQMMCWGLNASGQLGNGTTTDQSRPVAVTGMPKAVQLTSGFYESCARNETGTMTCWGGGQGISADDPANAVAGVPDAVQSSSGQRHACARTSGGAVYCWGLFDYYRLANYGQIGTTANLGERVPYRVPGIDNAVEVAAGANHTCARLADNSVRCWGLNSEGQLGNGTLTSSATPVVVSGLAEVVQLAPGFRHTCARLASGEVKCWGLNNMGQLGDGTTYGGRWTPVTVPGLGAGVRKVTAGGQHTCALRADRRVACWGDNALGQLGTGDTSQRLLPTVALDFAEGDDVTAGGEFTCARNAGGVYCWGSNRAGQLGVGAVDTAPHPRPLKAL
jgi:alpha-tubulin suppressor-like RCC1 family protein